MNKLYIKPSELIYDHDGGLPTDVADKMLEFHIMPVNQIRIDAGYPITASKRSGYRSKEHEAKKGRTPAPDRDWSRHTYMPIKIHDPFGKGATDWRTSNLRNMKDFGGRLISGTQYARICYYPNHNFFHCDYKFETRGQRLFIAGADGWTQVDRTGFINSIK